MEPHTSTVISQALDQVRPAQVTPARPEPSASPVDGRDWLALTRAVRGGDADAFEVLYEAWFDRAYTMTRSRTGRDESFCLDVVHDAMLRVIRTIRPMPSQADLDRWMARIVHGAALDALRRERRRIRRERVRPGVPDRIDSPLILAELDEQISVLRTALRSIPEADGTLLRHRFGSGQTLAQIGCVSGMGWSAAHGRIRRVISRLSRSMQGMRDEP